jgi:hypothetical protein
MALDCVTNACTCWFDHLDYMTSRLHNLCLADDKLSSARGYMYRLEMKGWMHTKVCRASPWNQIVPFKQWIDEKRCVRGFKATLGSRLHVRDERRHFIVTILRQCCYYCFGEKSSCYVALALNVAFVERLWFNITSVQKTWHTVRCLVWSTDWLNLTCGLMMFFLSVIQKISKISLLH